MDKICTGSFTQLNDHALIERAQEGDREAFEELYQRYYRPATSVAARICGRSAAEDAVQAAFLSIWRNLHGYSAARGNVKAWLLSIVRNRAIDVLREQSRRTSRQAHVEFEPEDPVRTEALVVHREVAGDLVQALGRLPRDQRRVLELAYFGDLSQSEIARTLRVPLGTVKGRTRLGLKKLPGHLANYPNDLHSLSASA